jgi:hypothetical protein
MKLSYLNGLLLPLESWTVVLVWVLHPRSNLCYLCSSCLIEFDDTHVPYQMTCSIFVVEQLVSCSRLQSDVLSSSADLLMITFLTFYTWFCGPATSVCSLFYDNLRSLLYSFVWTSSSIVLSICQVFNLFTFYYGETSIFLIYSKFLSKFFIDFCFVLMFFKPLH